MGETTSASVYHYSGGWDESPRAAEQVTDF